MSIYIGSWEFQGPFTLTMDLLHEPGIYAILSGKGDQIELLEIDETESVRAAIENHPWCHFPRHGAGSALAVAVYYCPDLTDCLRAGLVEQLLAEFQCARYAPGLQRMSS